MFKCIASAVVAFFAVMFADESMAASNMQRAIWTLVLAIESEDEPLIAFHSVSAIGSDSVDIIVTHTSKTTYDNSKAFNRMGKRTLTITATVRYAWDDEGSQFVLQSVTRLKVCISHPEHRWFLDTCFGIPDDVYRKDYAEMERYFWVEKNVINVGPARECQAN